MANLPNLNQAITACMSLKKCISVAEAKTCKYTKIALRTAENKDMDGKRTQCQRKSTLCVPCWGDRWTSAIVGSLRLVLARLHLVLRSRLQQFLQEMKEHISHAASLLAGSELQNAIDDENGVHFVPLSQAKLLAFGLQLHPHLQQTWS